jgi:hypothetical protein
LNGRKWILLHVLHVCDGSIQAALRDSIARIHHHPTLEVDAIAVSIPKAVADEWNSMIRHVEHVDESISVEDIGTR